MADEGGYPNKLITGIFGSAIVLLALYLDGVPGWGPLRRSPSVLLVMVIWLFISFLREFFRSDKSHSFLRVMTSFSGVFICSVLIGHLVLVRELRVATGEGFKLIGREMIFFLFVVIWITDTGAWFVGKLIGRYPLAPMISPKKTWVGSIGGTLLAAGGGLFFREVFLKSDLSRMEAVIFALIISIFAQFSDLIESLMKRSFGVKNSSELLPGHGGILDRFDSFIFAAPVFYYVLLSTGRFQ